MSRLEAALAELAAALREEVVAAAVVPAPDRLLDVDEAATVLGLGRTLTYSEISAGRLRSLVVGRRRLIPAAAIAAYIAEASAESRGAGVSAAVPVARPRVSGSRPGDRPAA